ncbi:MAG: hypothetical protein JHC33_12735, partial [Ignisphaera sp.]|nr:hypothetical protein [Ignisphaera sp.]
MSSYLDKLAVYSDKCRDGQDFINLRLHYIDINDINFPAKFSYPNSSEIVESNWIIDVDQVLPENVREKRTFCTKGKASVSFIGTTCIIRVGISYNWGNADVYIDGVRPSEIPNVINPLDTVSSNETLNVKNGYYDYVLADNLTPGQHTLELYINNDEKAFFVFTCIKYTDTTHNSLTLDLPLYINPYVDLNSLSAEQIKQIFNLCNFHNNVNLKVQNLTLNTVHNVNISLLSNSFIDCLDFSFDSVSGEVIGIHSYPKNTLVFPLNTTLLNDNSITASISVLPQYVTSFIKQPIVFQLSADYPDPKGNNIQNNTIS